MSGRAAPTDLALGVTGFLTSYLVAERGCSPATVASYARTVRSFLLHAESATGTAVERMSQRRCGDVLPGFHRGVRLLRVHQEPEARGAQVARALRDA